MCFSSFCFVGRGDGGAVHRGGERKAVESRGERRFEEGTLEDGEVPSERESSRRYRRSSFD